MSRLYREMGKETKHRISARLRGRRLSDQHKQAIAFAMRAYWANVPSKNNDSKNNLTDEKSM